MGRWASRAAVLLFVLAVTLALFTMWRDGCVDSGFPLCVGGMTFTTLVFLPVIGWYGQMPLVIVLADRAMGDLVISSRLLQVSVVVVKCMALFVMVIPFLLISGPNGFLRFVGFHFFGHSWAAALSLLAIPGCPVVVHVLMVPLFVLARRENREHLMRRGLSHDQHTTSRLEDRGVG